MTEKKDKKGLSTSLSMMRERAEAKARENADRMPENLGTLSPDETKRILHELRVHQIQLEMQNEELRRAQEELENSRMRYFDLYDLAPVGYISISGNGLILEANLTIAGLLNATRSDLLRKPFAGFIAGEDRDLNFQRLKQLHETKEPQAYEMKMLRKTGAPFWARIEATAAQDDDGAFICRAVLSDITERKRAQANLAETELRYLSRRVILAQEEERKRLSRELHDSIGQKIISMQLEITWLKKQEPREANKDIYRNIIKMTTEASEELQQICLGLRPLVMDRISFTAAVKELLEEFESNSDLIIDVRILPVDESRYSPETTMNMYRIIQESVSNIVRHSHTKTAFVSLREEDSELVLEVSDEGSGFEEDESSRKCSFGILGMRERANMCGGVFEIKTMPGKGTHIRVSVPAAAPAKEERI